MPVILRVKGYKFWFYQADLEEPPHVHVGRDGREAEFWLDPVAVARTGRFRLIDLREIERIIREHRTYLLDAWTKEDKKRAYREGKD